MHACFVGETVGASVGAAVGASVGVAVGAAVGTAVGAAVGMLVSPTLVGTAVGAAVGAHAVNTCVAELPLEKVYGPATTASPPGTFKVQDAPFQPSPHLSSM